MCIKSAGITENLQGVEENLQVLHNIGKVIMPRIRNRSGKDFVTKNKENRSEYRAFSGLGPRV